MFNKNILLKVILFVCSLTFCAQLYRSYFIIRPAQKNDYVFGSDATTLADIYDYVINPGEKICGENKGAHLLLISFNPSGTANFDERMAIRNTWTNKYYNGSKLIRNLFILGLSHNESANMQIRLESQLYGDILLGNFFDSYRNLTIKTILGIKWVSEYCDGAKFAMKIDDDMVVNVPTLTKYLNSLLTNNTVTTNNSMYGYCKTTIVQRENSKFTVTLEEYAGDVYPMYCLGSAYIFTSDLMKPMYNLTKYVKPFVMEDVYVGMLAKELNSTLNNVVHYWIYYPYSAVYYTYTCGNEYLHFVLVDSLEMFYTIWNLLVNKNFKL